MSGEVETLIRRGSAEIGVDLNQHMIKLLLIYLNELKKWNLKVNLTSRTDEHSIIINHFIDSLTVVPHLPATGQLLDAGSGAGFPGLPIKIARPELHVTLLEAKRKKINFLKQVILLLNLPHISALHGRIENLVSENRITCFDIIIARAFTKFDTLLKVSEPLLKAGGLLITMKGREGDNEVSKNKEIMESLSMEVTKKIELYLPETRKKRSLFFIMKR